MLREEELTHKTLACTQARPVTLCVAGLLRVGKVESLKVLPKRRCAFVNYVLAADAVKAIDTFQVNVISVMSMT